MKILQRYVARSYVTAFLLGMVVLTFVLSIGLLVKATQLVVKGLPPGLILRFLLVSIPESFSFTIPLAALVSALLVFGRLSSDGEISAMKACGINLWSVMLPLVGFGFLLTILSVFVNSVVAPRGYYERHLLSTENTGSNSMKLFEPDHFIDEFDGFTFWFASKKGQELHSLLIYDQTKKDFTREIRSEKAIVTVTNGTDLVLDMYNVRIEPFSEMEPGAATAARLRHTIPGALKKRVYRPKVGGFSNRDLLTGIIATNSDVAHCRADFMKREKRRDALDEKLHGLVGKIEKQAEDLSSRLVQSGATNASQVVAEKTATVFSTNSVEAIMTAGASIPKAVLPVTNLVALAGHDASRVLASAVAVESDIKDYALTKDRLLAEEVRIKERLHRIQRGRRRSSEFKTELSRRFALGLAPIAFLMIGMPLGIRASRRESNIGVVVSLGIMLVYYAFLIMAKSLAKNPAFYPHLLIWIPSLVCAVVAAILVRRKQ